MNDLLRELLNLAPFVQLTVHLADGRFFYVDHPDFAQLGRDDQTVEIYLNADRVVHVSLHHVASVETTQAEPRV